MRLAVMLLVSLAGCSRNPGPKLSALHVATAPTLDGEAEEDAWLATPSTGAFGSVLDGGVLSPHTELRALWSEEALYLALYCADQDVRSTDAVHLRLRDVTFRVAPSGKLEGAPPGVRLAVDLDGTLDADDGEDDEEWVAELAIPWAALGLTHPEPVELTAWREDTPKGAAARTVSWSHSAARPAPGRLELER